MIPRSADRTAFVSAAWPPVLFVLATLAAAGFSDAATDQPADSRERARSGTAPTAETTTVADSGRNDRLGARRHWAFRPLSEPHLPDVADSCWPRTRADRFVLGRIEAAGLPPSLPATKEVLIRRLYYDLTGLPPEYDQVTEFVSDESPDSYERLVDRLLASPRYGEHWARYWLDLVRYGEDNPNGELPARFAYRYRDWVVKSLNEDLPYSEFVRRQLAADSLPGMPLEELAALGFLGISPTYFKGPKQTKEVLATIVADEWEERIDVISRTLLALTVACARCHDHKFDPISMADYYALAGVVANSQPVEIPLVPLFEEDAFYIAELTAALRYHEKRYKQRSGQREGLKKENAPDVYRYDKEILESASEIQRIKSLLPPGYADVPRVNAVRDAAPMINDESFVIRELKSPEARFWTILEHDASRVSDLAIHKRGNASRPGRRVPRGFLAVLSPSDGDSFRIGSGRNELAEAILTDSVALAGRVIVNRIWDWHFGRPIVGTTSNFGELGDRPTHPALLDDLTRSFVSEGWSLKRLHRELVLSAAYRQSSVADPKHYEIDSENSLFARMNRRRLVVESWRDSVLSVAGALSTEFGGPSADLDDEEMRRRAIYGRVSRRDMATVLRLFDFPDPTRHSPRRNATTTPLQQLFFLNSDFMRKWAEELTAQIEPAGEAGDAVIDAVFRRVLGRPARPAELPPARELFQGGVSRRESVCLLVQSLLATNEFLFVD